MRLEGWEGRLRGVVDAARARPYELGAHDCFRLACSAIESITGVDRWPEFEGYRTKREALARLAAHGSTFEDAGDWFFGAPRIDWKLAQRGDIAALQTPDDGEKHLAVVLDHRMACLGEHGLQFLPLHAALCAWRVG